MKFVKCLEEAYATFDGDEVNFCNARYVFKDTTNSSRPIVEIWNSGDVCVYDAENNICMPNNETILKYCRMKENELVLVEMNKC